MQAILDVQILIRRDDELLFGFRKNTPYMDGHYGTFGGAVEPGEFIKDAAARELNEELGLVVDQELLRLVHVIQKRSMEERISFIFELMLSREIQPQNREPHKCDHLIWARHTDLPQPMIPYISFALERLLCGEVYSAYVE